MINNTTDTKIFSNISIVVLLIATSFLVGFGIGFALT